MRAWRLTSPTRWVLGAACVLALSGCPRNTTVVEEPALELEPMYFTMLRKGEGSTVANMDEEDMLSEAARRFEAGDPVTARKLFLTVVEGSSSREVRSLALFNVVVCELAMGNPGEALRVVERSGEVLAAASLEEKKSWKALKVQALGELGRWDDVMLLGSELLASGVPDEALPTVEDYVGRACAQLGDLAGAEGHFKASVDRLLDDTPIPRQYRNADLAGLYYRWGQLYEGLFRGVALRLPLERMTIDMADKIAFMRRAEELFLMSVRIRNPRYSAHAGVAVAELHLQMAADLLAAEVPGDLEPEDFKVYQDELGSRVIPYLERGVHLLEQTEEMTRMYGFPKATLTMVRGRLDKARQELDAFQLEWRQNHRELTE